MPPEQVAQADQALEDLIRRKTDSLASALDKALPNNATREHTVHLRLRICEVLLRADQESNAVVRMVQLWFWAIAFHAHIFEHTSGVFPGQDETLRAAATEICKGADEIVKKVLQDPGYSSLKKDLVAAATKGDAFYSIQPDQGSTFGQIMSATHLQSLLSLPLAPFNALNGIGEGAKGLDRLSDVGDKLVALINAYPTMMHLQVEMLILETQNQDLPRQIGANLERLTTTAEQAIVVARDTPLQVKTQIESLVKETLPEQKNLADLLDRATKMSESLRGLIESSQQLLIAVKPLLPPPPASGTVAQPSKPFDFQDLQKSLVALQSATHELRGLVDDATKSITSPHLEERAKEANQAVSTHVDQISMRVLRVIGAASLLGAVLIVLHRLLALRAMTIQSRRAQVDAAAKALATPGGHRGSSPNP